MAIKRKTKSRRKNSIFVLEFLYFFSCYVVQCALLTAVHISQLCAQADHPAHDSFAAVSLARLWHGISPRKLVRIVEGNRPLKIKIRIHATLDLYDPTIPASYYDSIFFFCLFMVSGGWTCLFLPQLRIKVERSCHQSITNWWTAELDGQTGEAWWAWNKVEESWCVIRLIRSGWMDAPAINPRASIPVTIFVLSDWWMVMIADNAAIRKHISIRFYFFPDDFLSIFLTGHWSFFLYRENRIEDGPWWVTVE